MKDFTGVMGIVFRSKPLKFVLINNKKSGNITFPAGGKEENESVEETLKRELKEETGLFSNEYKIIKTGITHEFTYNSKKKKRAGQTSNQPVFLIETKKEELASEDQNTEVLGWFSKEEIFEKLTFEDSKDLFTKVLTLLN